MKAFIDRKVPWYAVRTNIKSEEKAFLNLLRAGFRDVYLPRKVRDRINQRAHTRQRISEPLMPRYLFLGLRHSDFGLARACEGVEYILSERGQYGDPMRISAQLIEEIFIAETNLEFDETKEAKAYRGEKLENEFPVLSRVRVKVDHLLSGFEGVVQATDSRKNRVFVDMAIGRVEFDPTSIEAA